MKRRVLASAILLALATGIAATAASAQPAEPQSGGQAQATNDNKNASRLKTIVVTGSLIPKAQIETASPVITITSEQLTSEGFRNVYDALRSLPVSTGAVQDSQIAALGGFTAGATAISLFGLDPAFTLILLNGHPLANYPLPYNGVSDFVDLETIPTGIVDHIDVLSGGQSSLYGSSAVAGVVNIVLKRRMEGANLDFRVGGYDNGGGTNQRLQFSGGHSWNKLDLTFALSVENDDPIRFRQSFDKSRLDNPYGPPYVGGRDFLLFDPFSGSYVDPGPDACKPLQSLFGGTLDYLNRPGHGNFCGSYYDSGNTTLLNHNRLVNGYVNLVYQVNDTTNLYGEVLYGYSRPKINGGAPYWAFFNPSLQQSANPFSGVYFDPRYGFVSIQRFFAPEEIGGADANATTIDTRQFNVNLGVRGSIGHSDWDYDVYYNRSQVNTDSSFRWALTDPFNEFYLGPQQGTDPYGYGFPVFETNLDHLYTALSPQQFDAMTDLVKSRSVSWQQNVHVTLTNTDVLDLPAGAVGAAAIAEAGDETFNSPADPRLIAGDFNNLTGTQGAGSRRHYAIGGEVSVPVLSKVTADLSGRYDSYTFSGRTDAKATYKLGLEYRPVDTLLLRANYATAFRAPDLYFLFQGDSGFYTAATDYYYCRLQGYDQSDLSDCPQSGAGVFAFNKGNKDLKDITAKTFGYGLVWSPTAKFDLKIDYTHIAIDNEVVTQSLNTLLETEADCRLGTSFGGQTFDINSPMCQDALARVVRFPDDFPFLLAASQLQYLTVNPINIASETLSGIQAGSDYRVDMGRYGDLGLSAQYYVELNHKTKQNPGDTPLDLLHNMNSYEFKSRGTASVTWEVGKWTSRLYGALYGKAVDFLGTETFGRWAQFNGSLKYAFGDDASMMLTVSNIGNRRPPVDRSITGGNYSPPPYYNVLSYNGFGRAYWLQYDIKF